MFSASQNLLPRDISLNTRVRARIGSIESNTADDQQHTTQNQIGSGAAHFVHLRESDPVYQIIRTTRTGDLEVYIDTSADFAGDYESHTVQVCDDIEYHEMSGGEIVPEIVGSGPSQDGW